jgi:hypothetical protein
LGANQSESTDIKGRPFIFLDLNRNSLQFPRDLGGISGCSVWMIGSCDKPIEEWKKENSKIIAVQTGVYHKSQIIQATRWVAVSTLLHEAFPEVRPAMALWQMG